MSNSDPTSPDYGSGQPKYPPPPPPSGPAFPPPPATGAPSYPSPPADTPAFPGSGAPTPPSYGTPPPSPYGAPAPSPYGTAMPGAGGDNPYVVSGGPTGLPGGGTPPSMGSRLLARIIDGVLLAVVFFVLSLAGLGGLSATTGSDGQPSGFATGAFLTTMFVFVILSLAYEVVLIALRGATVGKQLMGLKVVQVDNGALPGWGPSIIRWALPNVLSMICGILSLVVYLSPFWADPTGRLRGYHDQLAKTVVISAR